MTVLRSASGATPGPVATAELHTSAHGPKDGSMTMGDGVDGRPYISDPIRERIAMAEPTYTRNPDGVDLIAQERRRQIDQEGYSPEHDRGHASSLAFAAAVYAAPKPIYVRTDYIDNGVGFANPWPTGWRKPNCSRLRELIRAGALIAAEIDRLIAEGATDGT